MKKRIFSTLLVSLLLVFGLFNVNGFAAEEAKTVDIMFLHDTHSHLNEFVTIEEGEKQVIGGFAKMKTLINEQLAENPDTLILDAGDFSMGTLVQVVFEQEASEIRMLGEIGVTATTFGNHEFDYRAKGLANMLNNAVASGDPLPEILACNIDWETMEANGLTEDQKLLKEAFENSGVKDYIVVEKNGVKIAIMGVIGQDSLNCVSNPPISIKTPVDAVKETVAEIQANENVDMIACISHSGTWENPDKSEDEILAKEVPELDFIVSGHTHTKLEEPIVHGNTYVVSAGEYGKYIGDMSLKQNSDGRWDLVSYELKEIEESLEKDPETQAKVDELMSMVDDKYLAQFGYTKDQVLCTNDITFTTNQDAERYHTEQNLGSIMADAYTYVVDNADTGDDHPVDMAVIPGGVIRDTFTVGDITAEDVFNVFSLGIGEDGIPGYPLISVYLTGEELKVAAEIDASVSDFMPTARLYTDGLYWNYNPNRMILNKVTDVYLCDANEQRVELEDDKLYRVVTDYYTSQMLGGVTDLSYGLLSIVPKFADGTPIEDYTDALITIDGKELKAWVAIAQYMDSFEDTNGDGVGEVPEKYGTQEGRKVVEDSKKLGDLLRNPNKFFFMIVGVVLLLIIIIILIVLLVRKVIRRIKRKK